MSTEGLETSELFQKWEELKVLIESLENDILKNVKGNKSAGVRNRLNQSGRHVLFIC